ncbi:MAG: class I SAM-dependent methyltransferase [Flavobacteriaceae bacterium]
MNRSLLLFLCTLMLSFGLNAQYNADDWQERDQWMDIERIMSLAGVGEEDHVADIGCHEGYLSMHLSKRVGIRGKVYAVDVRDDRLEKLNKNAADRNIYNITTILGDYDDPKLPKNELDVVVIMDTYHEMKDYMTILEHVKLALKPNGKIVILEKLKSHAKNKSRKEQTSSHTLAPKYVRKELQEVGFKVIEQVNNIGDWENNSSKKIWILVGILPDA